jgi:hypothetical protein
MTNQHTVSEVEKPKKRQVQEILAQEQQGEEETEHDCGCCCGH